jgi:hypothetical protein
MSNNDLTTEELLRLAAFGFPAPPLDIDPQRFAELLLMALVVQREGGLPITEAVPNA